MGLTSPNVSSILRDMITTMTTTTEGFTYDDGGRSQAAGHGGRASTGDCVPRAIAIATGKDYAEVYDEITERQREWCETNRSKAAKKMKASGRWQARHGVERSVAKSYLESLGWTWTPTMTIGSGTTVHLRADELPAGTVICSVTGHMVTVIDGVIHDTADPSRGGTRTVYGYWTKEAK